MRILEAAWSLRDTRASPGCRTISLKLSGTGIELSAIATEAASIAVPAAMHADMLLTIRTLNPVVDSKVSSWDPTHQPHPEKYHLHLLEMKLLKMNRLTHQRSAPLLAQVHLTDNDDLGDSASIEAMINGLLSTGENERQC